jgi:hypothetical protein
MLAYALVLSTRNFNTVLVNNSRKQSIGDLRLLIGAVAPGVLLKFATCVTTGYNC